MTGAEGLLISGAAKWFAGAGLGALSGFVAEWMKARQDARDKKHELDVMDRQLAFAEKRAVIQVADHLAVGPADIQADMEQTRLAYQGPAMTGIPLIDFMNGTLRPVAGYAAIGAFAVFSTVLLISMGHDLWVDRLTYREALAAFGESIIADTIEVVIGFLFGARGFKAGRSS